MHCDEACSSRALVNRPAGRQKRHSHSRRIASNLLSIQQSTTHSSTYVIWVFFSLSVSLSLWQVRNIFTLFTKIKTIPQYFLATAAAAATAASLFPSSTSVFASAASFFRRRTNFPKNFPQFSSVKFWSVSWQRVPSVVRREPRG